MLSDDIALFDEMFGDSDTAVRFRDAWQRIKKFIELAQQTDRQRNQYHEDIDKYYEDAS